MTDLEVILIFACSFLALSLCTFIYEKYERNKKEKYDRKKQLKELLVIILNGNKKVH